MLSTHEAPPSRRRLKPCRPTVNLRPVTEGALERSERRDKREIILDAALEVFSRKGVYGSPIADIAAEAGVAYGLVYHYFRNKEEILNTIFDERWALVTELLEGAEKTGADTRERLRGAAHIFLSSYLRRPQVVELLLLEFTRTSKFLEPVHIERIARAFAVVRRILERGQEDGEVRSDVPADLLMLLFVGGLQMIIQTQVLGAFREPEDWLGRARDSGISIVEVDRLDDGSVREYAEAVLGTSSLPQDFVKWLVWESGGNPTLIRQAIEYLVAREGLTWQPEGWEVRMDRVQSLQIPGGAGSTWASGIEELAPEELHIIQTAAVFGRHFGVVPLAQVLESDPDSLYGTLRDLAKRGVLEEWGAESFEFPHLALRESIYVNYLTDGGSLSGSTQLISHPLLGHQIPRAVEWTPPAEPGIVSIWAIVHDVRGGTSVARRFIRVEDVDEP